MRRRLLALSPLLVLLAALAWTVTRARLDGDGYEYLLMSRALSRHASSDVRTGDVGSLLASPPASLAAVPSGRAPLVEIDTAITRGDPGPVGGFVRARNGRYYSLHFWLYSLLLVPFQIAARILGAPFGLPFGLLNAACALAALAYLRRAFGPTARFHAAAWMFLLGGASFFIPWSGPEVMTASAVLVACVAMWRGDLGIGCLAAGIAACQNPSAALVFPALIAALFLLRRAPALAWPSPPPTAPLRSRKTIGLALAGALLAALPVAFSEARFGVPSAIALYATDPNLMSRERLFSLFFDLDQGMCVGAPGLLVGGAAAAIGAFAARGRGWGRLGPPCLAVCLVLAMSLPALVPHNWNAGTRAAMRYTAWLSMPLLALVLYEVRAASRRWAAALVAATLVPQLFAVALFGLAGTSDGYLRHNPLAAWVLARAPGLYNPVAEIFAERTTGVEGMPGPDRAVVLRLGGRPVKVMRHWLGTNVRAGICAAPLALDEATALFIGDGWRYVDAPFRCAPPGRTSRLGTWRFGSAYGGDGGLLGPGWSRPEKGGVWTDRKIAHLSVPVPAGATPRRLLWLGSYYRGNGGSEIRVGGVDLGTRSLADAAVELPAAAPGATAIDVELRHPDASSPMSHDESSDRRLLGLYLTALALEGEP